MNPDSFFDGWGDEAEFDFVGEFVSFVGEVVEYESDWED